MLEHFNGLTCLVLGDISVTNMLTQAGFFTENLVLRERGDLTLFDIEEMDYDLYCFTGGEDVDPGLYGQLPLVHTACNPHRDFLEQSFFRKIPMGTPKVGICRGGQFLNILSGGSMWQHVDGHTRTHKLIDIESRKTYRVTSTHHQMMRPEPSVCNIIATAAESHSKQTFGEKLQFPDFSRQLDKAGIDPDYDDIEVVHYHNTNSLCFQPHPEYDAMVTDTRGYFFKVLYETFQSEFTQAKKVAA